MLGQADAACQVPSPRCRRSDHLTFHRLASARRVVCLGHAAYYRRPGCASSCAQRAARVQRIGARFFPNIQQLLSTELSTGLTARAAQAVSVCTSSGRIFSSRRSTLCVRARRSPPTGCDWCTWCSIAEGARLCSAPVHPLSPESCAFAGTVRIIHDRQAQPCAPSETREDSAFRRQERAACLMVL